ncbi:MAG: hypothetical protein AVDCRST_MAG70-763 [uncultured Thermomicrobiales bacterium]|uniref:Uncharacterized protein n=1 Tax=uncultured Thermomicrobiales bacterium TaxID=1645740 RepID=A0A6J4UGH4_9BACT|nr:MAG: hypothetical protein AVDCRST_MAG70-763 [uncultured Thermomicrobiales bacterium]
MDPNAANVLEWTAPQDQTVAHVGSSSAVGGRQSVTRGVEAMTCGQFLGRELKLARFEW